MTMTAKWAAHGGVRDLELTCLDIRMHLLDHADDDDLTVCIKCAQLATAARALLERALAPLER